MRVIGVQCPPWPSSNSSAGHRIGTVVEGTLIAAAGGMVEDGLVGCWVVGWKIWCFEVVASSLKRISRFFRGVSFLAYTRAKEIFGFVFGLKRMM